MCLFGQVRGGCGPSQPKAKVDCIEDGRLTAVTWANETIDTVGWCPFKRLYRAEITNFKATNSCHIFPCYSGKYHNAKRMEDALAKVCPQEYM